MRRSRLVCISLALVVLSSPVAIPSASGGTEDTWLVTRSMARADLLGSRFPNIHTATCQPDRTSASKVYKSQRWWNRFLCSGRTRDNIRYRVTYRATGECADCWTITPRTSAHTHPLSHRPRAATPEPEHQPQEGVVPRAGTATLTATASPAHQATQACCPVGQRQSVETAPTATHSTDRAPVRTTAASPDGSESSAAEMPEVRLLSCQVVRARALRVTRTSPRAWGSPGGGQGSRSAVGD
jgi:hypothetical protein